MDSRKPNGKTASGDAGKAALAKFLNADPKRIKTWEQDENVYKFDGDYFYVFKEDELYRLAEMKLAGKLHILVDAKFILDECGLEVDDVFAKLFEDMLYRAGARSETFLTELIDRTRGYFEFLEDLFRAYGVRRFLPDEEGTVGVYHIFRG